MERRKFIKGAAAALSALLVPGVLTEAARANGRATARRTGRRTARRVTRRRVYTLPVGYRTVVAAGVTYYMIDGIRYAQQMEGGKVVYVEVVD